MKLDVFFGDFMRFVGGYILVYSVIFRVYFCKGKVGKRVVCLIDSLYFFEGEVVFRIIEKGVED